MNFFTQATLIGLQKEGLHFWISISDVEFCGDKTQGLWALANALNFTSTQLKIWSWYSKMETLFLINIIKVA